MSPRRSMLALSLAAALAACSSSGSTATSTAATTATSGGEHHAEGEHHAGGGEHHRRPALTPGMTAFHDVLRPLWHSEPGAGREGRACEQARTLAERATTVAAESAPAGAATDRWTATTQQLVASTADLQRGCEAAARIAIDRRLEQVHTAFHQVMEVLPPAAE
ncbi:MAG: hypothetical protein U0324_05450 [Polyangiales bacterium]